MMSWKIYVLLGGQIENSCCSLLMTVTKQKSTFYCRAEGTHKGTRADLRDSQQDPYCI